MAATSKRAEKRNSEQDWDLQRKPNYLPRLDASAYQSDAVVLWTFTTLARSKGWLNEEFHFRFRETFLHALARYHLSCPIYTLMPDHIHFVWMGLKKSSDQRKAAAFLRTYLEPLLGETGFQTQGHDHVLRPEERMRNGFTKVCNYIQLNPVRANLVSKPEDWPFSGAMIPGYPKLNPHQDSYWTSFWKIYQKIKAPDCGEHIVKRKMMP
jgi:REP element-mobilizing transposase RayT